MTASGTGAGRHAGLVVLVLAAGRGTRFNAEGTKLAAPLRGRAVLAHVLDTVRASGLPLRVLLAQAAPPPLRQLIESATLPAEQVELAPQQVGLGGTIAAGLQATHEARGWLVLPGDMPNVTATDLLAIADALLDPAVGIARPVFEGERGYPVGISQRLGIDWQAPLVRTGFALIKAMADAAPVRGCTRGVVQDVDTPADLAALA